MGTDSNAETNEIKTNSSIETRLQESIKSVDSAYAMLGKAYFDAHSDDPGAEFLEQIKEVKRHQEAERMWYQYSLSLNDKIQCEECKSIIPLDSAFCNKCGKPIQKLDFTSIKNELGSAEEGKTCPRCGTALIQEAVFCPNCGMKVCE